MTKGTNDANVAKGTMWKVTLQDFPIQGFADSDGVVHASRPKKMYYHTPHNARYTFAADVQITPGWYSESDLALFGLKPKDLGSDWFAQRRIDMDVRSDNYKSCHILAESKHDAISKFRKIFKIRSTDGSRAKFSVVPAMDSVTAEGPCDICKVRSVHHEVDPWDE